MKNTYDAIIFDMDGVLVSNESFTAAIKQTVKTMLRETGQINKAVNANLIAAVKNIPGFNNDWDVSYALTDLLSRNIPASDFAQSIVLLTDDIRQTDRYRRIKSCFQSVYLGNNYDGLIAQETLLIEKKVLISLSTAYPLGIATGRPKKEAVCTASNLGITPDCIPAAYIVSREDTKREKPFPDPLREAARRMKVKNPVYVGDTINDVLAAKRAGMTSIFVGYEKIGDIRIRNINNLKEVL